MATHWSDPIIFLFILSLSLILSIYLYLSHFLSSRSSNNTNMFKPNKIVHLFIFFFIYFCSVCHDHSLSLKFRSGFNYWNLKKIIQKKRKREKGKKREINDVIMDDLYNWIRYTLYFVLIYDLNYMCLCGIIKHNYKLNLSTTTTIQQQQQQQ